MENNKVEFKDENNEIFEMVILKEFEHKKKKYAILMEDDCKCDDHCECNDDCECDDHCGCDDHCECNDDCDCGCNDHCECDDDCDCDCGCDDHCECNDDCDCGCNDKGIYIFEITKDKDGNEVFEPIKDEKEFEDVVKKADKVLYEEE